MFKILEDSLASSSLENRKIRLIVSEMEKDERWTRDSTRKLRLDFTRNVVDMRNIKF